MNDRFDRRPSAKPAREEYRRRLPHLQAAERPLFVTFCTFERWTLPDSVRGLVLRHCLHDHRLKLFMFGAVVMPDHVHLILKPMDGLTLSRIMKGIKGVSANRLNQLRQTSGACWQAESFDRILRNEQEFEEKLQYMLDNPAKAGLASSGWEYEGWYFNPDFN